jgi:hypothetical protein
MKRSIPRRGNALVLAALLAAAPAVCEAQAPAPADATLVRLSNARALLHQGQPSRAIEALRPLTAQGCDAVANYLMGVAYSRLDAHAQTARAVLRALECRPRLNPTLTRGADRLLDWAALREAFGPSHRASTGGLLSVPGEKPPDAFAAKSANADWQAIYARIRARNPGIDKVVLVAKSARQRSDTPSYCAVANDPQSCGEPLEVPDVSLGD